MYYEADMKQNSRYFIVDEKIFSKINEAQKWAAGQKEPTFLLSLHGCMFDFLQINVFKKNCITNM